MISDSWPFPDGKEWSTMPATRKGTVPRLVTSGTEAPTSHPCAAANALGASTAAPLDTARKASARDGVVTSRPPPVSYAGLFTAVTPMMLPPVATERKRRGRAARTPGEAAMPAATWAVPVTGLRITTSPVKRCDTHALPPLIAPVARALTATALATLMVRPDSVRAVRLRRLTRLRAAVPDRGDTVDAMLPTRPATHGARTGRAQSTPAMTRTVSMAAAPPSPRRNSSDAAASAG